MPTAHIYTRVSTDEQDLSPAWQADVCKRYYETTIAPRGYDLGKIYADIGQSAFHIPWQERKEGRELFKDIRPGDCIIAAKQDRVWRNNRDRENCLFYLRQMDIRIVLLDTQVDMTTAAGKFAAGIVALQAEWESETKSERQKAAHAVRRQRRVPGKANPPPGWRFDRHDQELVPDERERMLLTMIYRWRSQRVRTVRKTCQWLWEEGIRRDNGKSYNHQWVHRAYVAYRQGWPCIGYVKQAWRDAKKENQKLGVPKLDGMQYIRVTPANARRPSEADLRWLSAAFLGGNSITSLPAVQKSPRPVQDAG